MIPESGPGLGIRETNILVAMDNIEANFVTFSWATLVTFAIVQDKITCKDNDSLSRPCSFASLYSMRVDVVSTPTDTLP
ncbi:hypothetical protein BHE90_015213 [Fusarium euwallaceae]|uniref:Uncharacterized protein n=2 Tax=Fusarium solani species complex TaxID=232080 RepID=A0A430L3V6_9HYPO|nr:hypothetical protein CEP51_011217 [Fusarium floridanum]RTE70396.1 hypothetical protein BHE90_015213 [Fusarium euwallaceae]